MSDLRGRGGCQPCARGRRARVEQKTPSSPLSRACVRAAVRARAFCLHVPPPLRARGRALRARAAPRRDVALTLRTYAPARVRPLHFLAAPRAGSTFGLKLPPEHAREHAGTCVRTYVRAYVRTCAMKKSKRTDLGVIPENTEAVSQEVRPRTLPFKAPPPKTYPHDLAAQAARPWSNGRPCRWEDDLVHRPTVSPGSWWLQRTRCSLEPTEGVTPTDGRRGCICLTGHAEWRASAGWRAQVRQCRCYAKSPERIVLEEGGDFEGNLLYFLPPGTYMQVLAVENSKGCTSVQVRYHHPSLPGLEQCSPRLG